MHGHTSAAFCTCTPVATHSPFKSELLPGTYTTPTQHHDPRQAACRTTHPTTSDWDFQTLAACHTRSHKPTVARKAPAVPASSGAELCMLPCNCGGSHCSCSVSNHGTGMIVWHGTSKPNERRTGEVGRCNQETNQSPQQQLHQMCALPALSAPPGGVASGTTCGEIHGMLWGWCGLTRAAAIAAALITMTKDASLATRTGRIMSNEWPCTLSTRHDRMNTYRCWHTFKFDTKTDHYIQP